MFDDSDDQIPPAYLAKTPIPLRALATGREIRGEREKEKLNNDNIHHLHLWLEEGFSCRGKPTCYFLVLPGDYVLRDPAGGPRGMVRVLIKWKYPFQPSMDTAPGRQGRQLESTEMEEMRREEAEASTRPIAKPRVKVILVFVVTV